MIGLTAVLAVCAAIYAVWNYSRWSAANPTTRLIFMPTSRSAKPPKNGDLHSRLQITLMVAAGIFAGEVYTSMSAGHTTIPLAVAWMIVGYLPSLAVAGFLIVRHNRRVKIRLLRPERRRPMPGRLNT